MFIIGKVFVRRNHYRMRTRRDITALETELKNKFQILSANKTSQRVKIRSEVAFKGRGCAKESVSAVCRRCRRRRRRPWCWRCGGGGRCERSAAVAPASSTLYRINRRTQRPRCSGTRPSNCDQNQATELTHLYDHVTVLMALKGPGRLKT